MCLGNRHKAQSVKMLFMAYRRKPLPDSPKHNLKSYFEYKYFRQGQIDIHKSALKLNFFYLMSIKF